MHCKRSRGELRDKRSDVGTDMQHREDKGVLNCIQRRLAARVVYGFTESTRSGRNATLPPSASIVAMATLARLRANVLTQSAGEWSAVMAWPGILRDSHRVVADKQGALLGTCTQRLIPSVLGLGHEYDQYCHSDGYNIFCTGFGGMADGKLFMAGGHIADNVGLDSAATLTIPYRIHGLATRT